jgi:hypothetical protein
MGDGYRDPDDGWVGLLRARRTRKRAMRADRRARRRARLGGTPDDAVTQGLARTFRGGGYFTTKSPPKD